MKTLRYSDNQPARKGDTFTAPRWGTCRITGFDKANACAVAVNTSTGEVFDMLGQPTFGESDLIARETVTHPTEDVNLAAPNQQARGFILRPTA